MNTSIRSAAELILAGPSGNGAQTPDHRSSLARRPFAGAVPR